MPCFYRLFSFHFVAGLACILNASAAADEVVSYECQVEAKQGENFDYAAVQLWVPTGSKKVSGILCLVLHPLGEGGSKLAHPEPWIELSNRNNCALVAVSFAQTEDATREWCRADQGTGRALFAALDSLALKSGISNLSFAPIVGIGVCAAGQFAYHLAALDPTRIAAFVTIGGGKHDLSKIESAAKVPGLLVATPDRGAATVQNLNALYLGGRSHSAPWLRTSQNISFYDAGLCSASVVLYLQETLGNFRVSSHDIAAEVIRSDSLSSYLPISICGQKILPLGSVDHSEMELGAIDSLAAKPTICSFDVIRSSGSNADGVLVSDRDPGISTDVEEIKTGCWHVTCRLDPKKLSLGPLHIEVPIRFLQKGSKLLGGIRTILTGFVTGEVECLPRNLNFGVLEAGKSREIEIHLFSKSPMAIRINKITSTFPWIAARPLPSVEGTTKLWCSINPPGQFRYQGFCGYLQIQMESPSKKLLRVLYYGSVN